MTNEKICTSSASSDQPPKQAAMVRRSRAVRSENQANMTSRPLLVWTAPHDAVANRLLQGIRHVYLVFGRQMTWNR